MEWYSSSAASCSTMSETLRRFLWFFILVAFGFVALAGRRRVGILGDGIFVVVAAGILARAHVFEPQHVVGGQPFALAADQVGGVAAAQIAAHQRVAICLDE